MGNQVSSANREMTLKATLPVRKVCDQILEYMLKEINIKDFYLLATKRECSRYVIFLANQMNKTFRNLSFAPARGPAGVLYFQPIDILQNPTPQQQAERQSLCLFLAYFYVRIFQIYGALSLTLVDDANVYVKFKEQDGLSEAQAAQARRDDAKRYGMVGAPNPVPRWFDVFRPDTFEREPGIYPYRPSSDKLFRPPSQQEYLMERGQRRRETYDPYTRRRDRDPYRDAYRSDYRYEGGALLAEDKLGKFKFLKNLLDSAETQARVVDSLDYKKDIGHRIQGVKGTFKLGEKLFATDAARISDGSFFFEIPVGRGRARFYEVKTEVVNHLNVSVLRIIGIRYSSLIEEALSARSRYGIPSRSTSQYEIERSRLHDFMYKVFGRENGEIEIIQTATNEYKMETRRGQESVTDFLKSLKEQFDLLLKFRRESEFRDVFSRDSRVTGDIDANLDIKYTLTYLQEKKPIAHCVARGLQLLGNKNPGGTFTPAICSTKFLIGKRDFDDKTVVRSGGPEIGEKITTNGGIQALSNLFYDTLLFKSNKLIRSHRAIADYVKFMKQMAQVFLDPQEGATTVEKLETVAKLPFSEQEKEVLHPNFTKLDNISDTKMKFICEGLNMKVEDTNPRTPEGRRVLGQVSKLFGRQIQHAANCGTILRQLFTTVSINGIVSVRINKTVFIKGVLELNRINDLARSVLIRYYTDCEALYTEGVQAIQASVKAKGSLEAAEEQQFQKLAKDVASVVRVGGFTRKKQRTFEVA